MRVGSAAIDQLVIPNADMVAIGQFVALAHLDLLAVHEHAVVAAFVEEQNAFALAFEQRVMARSQLVLFKVQIAGACSSNVYLLIDQHKFIGAICERRADNQAWQRVTGGAGLWRCILPGGRAVGRAARTPGADLVGLRGRGVSSLHFSSFSGSFYARRDCFLARRGWPAC